MVAVLFSLLLLSVIGYSFPADRCDGISPDTVFVLMAGGYNSGLQAVWSSHPDSASCAFYGDSSHSACGVLNNGEASISQNSEIKATSMWYSLSSEYQMQRGIAMFRVPLHTMRKVDSVDLHVKLGLVNPQDDDTLFVLSPTIKCKNTCDTVMACYDDSCNFYRCGGSGASWPTSYLDYYAGDSVGWVQFDIDGECCAPNDTVVYGFATRLLPDGPAPTSGNEFWSEAGADTSAMLIYYYSLRHNDISHQDNADGISPDTIQFICSGVGGDIATPGFWSGSGYYWNGEAGPGAPGSGGDGFFGPDSVASFPPGDTVWFDCWNCGLSGCGGMNRAMQPHIEATLVGGGYNYYLGRRAFYLMELEKSIPDTTVLDSMRLYLKFALVNVDEGDSLFVVTYTPRDTDGGGCIVDYKGNWDAVLDWFGYPIIYGGFPQPGTRWCNFYKCGSHYIWGDIPDRSYGRIPQYLDWVWFPIHPSIIDFHAASVGDTFGIGLILKDEHSAAPTDTNDVSIITSPCPYIVYWFSEPEDSVTGFINWGLRPPHLGWGLPINQARKAWGGGRRP